MTTNEVILLNSTLGQKKAQIASSLSDSDFFEIFSFEQILKNYDLSYDELLYGKVGAGRDGGIDGFFTLINGEILTEDTDISEIRRGSTIELYLIQAKRSQSFTEAAIDRINTTAQDLFNLDNDLADFRAYYDPDLIDKADIFRNAYISLASKHPNLIINYFYASKGRTTNIHPNVHSRVRILKETTTNYFPGSKINMTFLGARELLDASRKEKSYTLQIRFLESYISRGENDYVILCSLEDYFRFTSDEDGNLRRYVFESNVRDWQGNVEVNKDIQKTLESDDDVDFWWLNNGITVLASKASIAGKTITLDDVQIVNGLQTTVIIYDYLKGKSVEDKDERRSILIRIIVTEDSGKRDRIIKATNFQTAIPAASLKASDPIQRDIEEFFLQNGLYYDRRKNYYKNTGKPADKIIGIPYLAQATMAVILHMPDYARARPTSLIKRQEDYQRVFNESLGLKIYLVCARLMKKIDNFIRNHASDYEMRDKTDLKFHILMTLIAKLTGTKDYQVADVEALLEVDIQQDILDETVSEVVKSARSYSRKNKIPIEKLVKTREFVTYLTKRLKV